MAGKILNIVLLAAAAQLLHAQSDDRLRLISADILENQQINGQSVQMLNGNVVFRKGPMEMLTDRAIFDRDRDRTNLAGSVSVTRPGEHLVCDSLIFYNLEDRIHARGHVRFDQEDQTIESRSLIYWTKLDSGVARDDVVMTQEARRLTAAEFRTIKTGGIRGASFDAFGAVVVGEGDRRVVANEMHYDDNEGVLVLLGSAVITDAGRELKGELVRMVYQDEQIKSAFVQDGAEATATIYARLSEDERDERLFTDLLTSRTMDAAFVNDRLSQLQLQGMATSIYHVVEDSILQGVNNATGDTIMLGFDEASQLVRIRVDGGARGRFEPEAGATDVDTTVIYKAEHIDYDIPGQVTYMERGAQVDYRGNGLAAGSITLTWEDNILRAEYTHNEPPTLLQTGRDPMVGDLMEFDLISEKGKVFKGRTKLEDGYYHGNVVHRHPGNVYYVENSKYTTCNLDNPHFYFAAKKMKMLQGDKVIAKPVVLYLFDVPLLGLPFAVFPNKAGGRRTGLIMPSYGESRRDGQFLKDLGYFWAINDYADATMLMDFSDKLGITASGRIRYNVRYKYNGNIFSTYYREVLDRDIQNLLTDQTSLKWKLRWIHRQTIDPTRRLNINFDYVSNPRIYDLGRDRETRLGDQQILSKASYSSKLLTLGLQEKYILTAVNKKDTPPVRLGQEIIERTRTLPSLSLSRTRSSLIKQARGGRPRWYNNLSASLSSSLINRQTVFWQADTAGADSLYWTEDTDVRNQASARNNLSLNLNQKVFKYISMTFSAGINQAITPEYRQANTDSMGLFARDTLGAIEYHQVSRLVARHTGRLSVGAQTNIYGMFPVNVGNLVAIRHVIKPNIRYSYSPDFSQPIFGWDPGYVQHDAAGEKFDRFAGSTIGGTPSSESQALSFSMTNLFQAKQEINGKEKKINLLTWSMSTNYNFTADSLHLAPINSSFRSPFLKMLNLNISTVHDFYELEWDQAANRNRRVNKLLSIPRLASMNANTRFRLKGTRFVPPTEVALLDTAIADTFDINLEDEDETPGFRRGVSKSTVTPGNLWEATLAFRYRLQPSLPAERRETFWMNTNLKVNIGPGWSVGYTARFDMQTQELVSHDIQIYREIHCWELAFSWTPGGTGQGFLFRLNVRDPDLEDIKYESRGGRQSGLGF